MIGSDQLTGFTEDEELENITENGEKQFRTVHGLLKKVFKGTPNTLPGVEIRPHTHALCTWA